MRIIRNVDEVDRILKDKRWQMAGPVKRMLGPLLGEGIILATGEDHTAKRRVIGKHLNDASSVLSVIDNYIPPIGKCDIGLEMLKLSEQIISSLFGVASNIEIAHLVRKCVALAPFRLFGLPLDFWYIGRLNKLLAKVDLPDWLGNIKEKDKRDWIANLFVAGIDTLSSEMTAKLVNYPLLPIWWLPRRNVDTGENVVLMLSTTHKFGGGFRRCVGEHISKAVVARLRERFTLEVVHADSDIRPVGVITCRLKKVIGELRFK